MEKKDFGLVVLETAVLTQFDARMKRKYFEWFQDFEIQKETATEGLTLEEVDGLEIVWAKPEVYTFIICDKNSFDLHMPQESMIGDVNLFIEGKSAEINVMVAEKRFRRMGIASQVIDFVIRICKECLGLKEIVAKIGQENVASIGLFRKKGFVEVQRVEDFQEIHFSLKLVEE
jgi:RimJ/RimL family protein N-acetyltransferase